MVGCGGSSNNPEGPTACNTADAAPATGICTAADFNKIRDNLTTNYKLLANIDLSKDYSDWTPIGVNDIDSFTGTLDGNGYTISGLKFQNTNSALYTGLFGYIDNAEIENLNVEVANAGQIILSNSNDQYFGVIAGYANGANLTKITVSSTAPLTIQKSGTNGGSLYVGGVVGTAKGALIKKSTSSTTFKATNTNSAISYAGGIAGYNFNSGAISNSYTTGDISANGNGAAYAGGIVGYNRADINNTYTSGDILANDDITAYAGGIAALTSGGAISNSVALNKNITASGINTAEASRISYGGNLTNNFALSAVTLSDGSGTRSAPTTSLASGNDGLNQNNTLTTSSAIWADAVTNSGLGWDFLDTWDWNVNRPVLR
jgi:hypothetical protein